MSEPIFAFGRIADPDARDLQHLIRDLPLAVAEPRAFRYWNADGWWGNQGSAPKCVGYASAHWLEDGPVTHPGPIPILHPDVIYREAQEIDPWAGTPHEGTTVRCAFKVLQRRGHVISYHWAFTLDDVVFAVLNHGPVVMGTSWYEGMSRPGPDHRLRIEGEFQGGHAWTINGVNVPDRVFRMKNSWGREWGKRGFALIGFDEIDQLLTDQGEACLAVEAPSA